MTYSYLVIFEHPEEGTDWGAYVPDLPGLIAVGKTKEECAERIAEAIEFHLEGMVASGETIPVGTVEAEVVRVPLVV